MITWIKRQFICRFFGHRFYRARSNNVVIARTLIPREEKVRLYFCDRCGKTDPRITIADKGDSTSIKCGIDKRQ